MILREISISSDFVKWFNGFSFKALLHMGIMKCLSVLEYTLLENFKSIQATFCINNVPTVVIH